MYKSRISSYFLIEVVLTSFFTSVNRETDGSGFLSIGVDDGFLFVVDDDGFDNDGLLLVVEVVDEMVLEEGFFNGSILEE